MSMRKEHQWILLESSGELSRRKQRRLQRALQQDPGLQCYADEVRQITRLARDTAPEAPAWNTTSVEYQARRHRQNASRGDFLTLWQPALAYGAIAIALGMTVIYLSRNWEASSPNFVQQEIQKGVLDWEDPYLGALEELSLQLAGFEEDLLYPKIEEEWMSDELDILARKLLELGESS